MIAVVLKSISWLKILQPIMLELKRARAPYILYHMPSSSSDYNNPTFANIRKTNKPIIKNAKKVVSYADNLDFLAKVKNDKIDKIICVEAFLSLKSVIKDIKNCNIRIYSLGWLIDSLWETDVDCVKSMDRIYYTTKYIKETLQMFLGIRENTERDCLLGSPLLPYPSQKQNNGDKLLILLPNAKSKDYKYAFTHEFYFGQAMRVLANGHDLLYKTRPKQWIYPAIKSYTKNDIISDGCKLYPPPTWEALKRSHTTMLFFSSGVFEAVLSGNYVLNVPINLKRYKQFGWPSDRLKYHFSGRKNSLYNWPGCVESVRMAHIISGKWKLKGKIDEKARQKWIDTFVGPVYKNPAREIVKDILDD